MRRSWKKPWRAGVSPEMSKSRHAADQKRAVWEGRLKKTDSGLVKSDLALSKSGQVVSRKRQEQGIKQMAKLRAQGKAAAPFKKMK
jgi:hypothetical protein